MKALAERAKEYEPDPIDEAEILPVRVGYMVDKVRLGYINGAKEQQAIDIDNACIILCRYVCPYDSNQCLNAKCDTWDMFRRKIDDFKRLRKELYI